jgi:hypothetical protein
MDFSGFSYVDSKPGDTQVQGFIIGTPTPEPATWLAMCIGLAGILLYSRRNRLAKQS